MSFLEILYNNLKGMGMCVLILLGISTYILIMVTPIIIFRDTPWIGVLLMLPVGLLVLTIVMWVTDEVLPK